MCVIFPNDNAQEVVDKLVENYLGKPAQDFYKNKVDPFSALFDSMLQGMSLDDWKEQEIARQRQKTLQNLIGGFHENIISSFEKWEKLRLMIDSDGKKRKILDVKNSEMKIVAEIKNKFNTTKGNHKVQIYRDISAVLSIPEFDGYTGYYVEIIPSGRGTKTLYDKPFVPSDNTKSGQRVIERTDIRVIDGRNFYHIVTGQEDALKELYKSLPQMIRNALGKHDVEPENEELFQKLFNKAFT